jgi:hypothetical protein
MATEIYTGPHADAAGLDHESGLDPKSLAAIRDLLATEPKVEAQPVAERQAAKAEVAIAPVSEKTRLPREPRQIVTPTAPVKSQKKAEKRTTKAWPKTSALLARAKARMVGYRPSPKHIVFACLALLVIFRPWLVLGIVLLCAFIVAGVFLILGYDGFWLRSMALAQWYARRRPARSAELQRKIDTFTMKWDAMLDRFPEGSVDGLYLPNFGDLAEAEARHDAALDRRFESLRQNKA